MNRMIGFVALVALLFVSACGGRDAKPVQTTNQSDISLSCQQIELELLSNSEQVKRLIKEHGKTTNQNVAIGAFSALVFLPGLLALDLKGAAKEEANALISRNRHLVNLANQKNCQLQNVDLNQATKEFKLNNGPSYQDQKKKGIASAD